ncbi:thiol peroxidase [Terracoccus luteus]|jgi:thiol peroxidase|uniref:Thiol peroxidase n=1 Tax=Terracoccus luteus TaxID=53356 RepID=A0A495XZ84_9MICO|nr:thiol peroxidase [Terracoccus luteus]MBB2986489.1 thiol peroxidase [Terracoccus luteus]MCP2171922.1 thiol peroxidase [Terracoccus luteus]RKT79252.1 thiol peroxidase [Terracoccus luteus]
MAITHLGETEVHTVGELPAVGTTAPDFTLTGADLGDDVSRPTGIRTVLNIFPSVDTGVCSASVRRFNEIAAGLDDATVVCVSNDLPFAMARFCGAEGIENVTVASAFRCDFGDDYGVTLADGGFRGLLARAVVVLDRDGSVLHTELVPSIGQEPDYDAAVASLG